MRETTHGILDCSQYVTGLEAYASELEVDMPRVLIGALSLRSKPDMLLPASKVEVVDDLADAIEARDRPCCSPGARR